MHVDDDEGGFGGKNGDREGGGANGVVGGWGGRGWCRWVGEVEAGLGVIEPEGGVGVADNSFAVGLVGIVHHGLWVMKGAA